VSRGPFERLCDIKERCEQLVQDLHGDPGSVAKDRVLAKAALYDLHVIGEACAALPEELRARHPEVDWKGWKDFRNLTTHVYWRADAAIAAEAMERAIPVMVAIVAAELPEAASVAGVAPSAPELNWSLQAVGEVPNTDEEAAAWWGRQQAPALGGSG
jgi:uncharacterized protein with HEPN domain